MNEEASLASKRRLHLAWKNKKKEKLSTALQKPVDQQITYDLIDRPSIYSRN